MAIDENDYKRALEAAHHLSIEQRRRLIKELARELETSATPLALIGTWPGVSLDAEEIDQARRECWASLGEDD